MSWQEIKHFPSARSMADADGEQKQVTVKLHTRLPAQFRVPLHPLAVPAQLTRFGLSEVVNSLLKLDKEVPFDFLINDQLLQVSLATFLLEHSISAESVLSVEYLPAVGPFTPQAESPHPDWVSSVTGAVPGFAVTGSYDGVARLWSVAQGRALGQLVGHTAGVTCVSARDEEEDGRDDGGGASMMSVLTGSKDGTARLWRIRASAAASRLASASCAAELRGHSDGLAAVTHSPDGQRCATGAWDSSLCIWRLDSAAAVVPDAGGKRRKKGAETASGDRADATAVLAPDATLTGHTGCVSANCWSDAATLYSGGWDHTLRCWDIDSGTCTSILNDGGSKAVFAVHLRAGTSLLAFCGAERAVRVWDTRSGATVASKVLPGGHSSWVTAVRWCPWHEHQLLSAGHDGCIVLWDIRGTAPVHSAAVSTDKLLAADWARAPGVGTAPRRVAAGGADAHVHILSSLTQAL